MPIQPTTTNATQSDPLAFRTAPEIEQLLSRFRAAAQPAVVTIGTFDGVHHGHRGLIGTVRRMARERGLAAIAVTFSPRPEQLFSSSPALPDICSLDDRVRRLRAAGADDVVVVPFTPSVAALDYGDFARVLTDDLQMRALVVGEDFALGRGRLGTPDRLRALGLEVHEHALLPNAARTAKASSSSIRRALAAGLSEMEALAAA